MADPVSDPLPADPGGRAPTIRKPTLWESLLAIAILIVLITMTVALFGTDSTGGPLQVALLLAALGAGLLSWRLGNSSAAIRDAAIGGVSSAMGAVFILLAVGALIGTWNMAGTIPTWSPTGSRSSGRTSSTPPPRSSAGSSACHRQLVDDGGDPRRGFVGWLRLLGCRSTSPPAP